MATEKRLIDAIELANFFGFMRKMWSGSEIINVIHEAETVDAVEVVHGRWIEHIEIGAMNNHYECSACHWKTPFFTIARDSNYCPNCGAKMDGDGNEP